MKTMECSSPRDILIDFPQEKFAQILTQPGEPIYYKITDKNAQNTILRFMAFN